jgi:hypothetical protein
VREPDHEARPDELVLLVVVAQHVADVLAQVALDALPELLDAVDILLHHPVRGAHHAWLLLACLLAPAVMLERHDREESRRGVLSRSEVRSIIFGAIDNLGERFSLSHARAKRTAATLELFQRLCEPPPMDWTVRYVTSHPQWSEAVLLFEMLADATGEGHEMLEAWLRHERTLGEFGGHRVAGASTRSPITARPLPSRRAAALRPQRQDVQRRADRCSR